MRNRPCFSLSTLAVAIAVALCAPAFVGAQTQSATAARTAASTSAKADTSAASTKKPWVMPRTPDGHPDLHGYWTSLSYTPMERPAKYANREFLTDKETQDIFNAGVKGSFDGTVGSGEAEDDPTSADYDFKTYGLQPGQKRDPPTHP